eukprot:CAMPEP_0174881840 /NCGR_PEP_ID=MMETSP1114-20130205/84463_1 /TAXON_ID=312471 /ORGANISM="Neobodo designis, Strain CCAP 1951/1" /LENGTH=269 /DNA_ID=CAMNT_0016117237 /DNA_START=59 /DNA_END=869 /DNA_ORIENTATION=+
MPLTTRPLAATPVPRASAAASVERKTVRRRGEGSRPRHDAATERRILALGSDALPVSPLADPRIRGVRAPAARPFASAAFAVVRGEEDEAALPPLMTSTPELGTTHPRYASSTAHRRAHTPADQPTNTPYRPDPAEVGSRRGARLSPTAQRGGVDSPPASPGLNATMGSTGALPHLSHRKSELQKTSENRGVIAEWGLQFLYFIGKGTVAAAEGFVRRLGAAGTQPPTLRSVRRMGRPRRERSHSTAEGSTPLESPEIGTSKNLGVIAE